MTLLRQVTAVLITATIFTLLLFFSIATGCRDREIATYTIPKENPPPVPAAPAAMANPKASNAPVMPGEGTMAGTPVITAAGAELTWTAPAHWETRPPSAMRKATYLIPAHPINTDASDGKTPATATAELAVTAFPGDVGGNLANINRWRQQLQLPPITAGELPQTLHHIDAGALHIDVVEILGPTPAGTTSASPTRMLGAIVPVGGATWFFKLTGPDALVAAERKPFETFLKTIRIRK